MRGAACAMLLVERGIGDLSQPTSPGHTLNFLASEGAPPASRAHQFDHAILELFPDIDAQAQPPRRLHQAQALLRAQVTQISGSDALGSEDTLQRGGHSALRQWQGRNFFTCRADHAVGGDKIDQLILLLGMIAQERELDLFIPGFFGGQPRHGDDRAERRQRSQPRHRQLSHKQGHRVTP